MKTKFFAFDETYDLDNVYNCDSDELYVVGKATADGSVWYN